MIESLLEDLPPHGAYDKKDAIRGPKADVAPTETSFLASLPIVQRIVARRRSHINLDNRPDLVQEVALRIWRWGSKHQDKSDQMSGEDWNAFAARTAYNEVNRQLCREGRLPGIPLEEVSEIQQQSVAGQTDIEVFSLLEKVWQATCELSLRQRRSLLLHSQDLIIYFVQIGVTDKDLAGVLELSDLGWQTVRDRLPMTDIEIVEIAGGTAGSIKKARYEARLRLEGSIGR